MLKNKIVTFLSRVNTPVRTHSISGLKSRVMKLSFLSLKMMVKSGLEFILKLTEPLQRYLLSCQANSANLGKYFCTGQQQLWRGSVNFKINFRPLFTIIFKLKNDNFKTRDFSPLIERVLAGVFYNTQRYYEKRGEKVIKNWKKSLKKRTKKPSTVTVFGSKSLACLTRGSWLKMFKQNSFKIHF